MFHIMMFGMGVVTLEIYADVVFAINFVMDTFILWVVSKMAHRKTKLQHMVLGGLCMALGYCLFIFLVPLHRYLNVFASVGILMIGVVVTFRPKTVREFFKIIFFSYISSFALGGMGMAFFYFTNISDVLGNMIGFTVSNFSLKILLASTCVFYVLIKLSLNWYNSRVIKKQVYYPVKIFYDEHDVLLTALLDTGNSLYDPVSDLPVIIAEFNALKTFLPDSVRLIFYENYENNLSLILENINETSFSGRIRMIPFASLGKQHGLLLGFRPDKVEIGNESDMVTLKDVVVGIYNCQLSNNGAYQGLLHPELIGQY